MPTPAPSERKVKEVITEVYLRSPREGDLDWEKIGNDFPLYSLEEGEDSLGLDSLDAVEIATALEETFDVVLPTEIDPVEIRTVNKVMELLVQLHEEQHGDTS